MISGAYDRKAASKCKLILVNRSMHLYKTESPRAGERERERNQNQSMVLVCILSANTLLLIRSSLKENHVLYPTFWHTYTNISRSVACSFSRSFALPPSPRRRQRRSSFPSHTNSKRKRFVRLHAEKSMNGTSFALITHRHRRIPLLEFYAYFHSPFSFSTYFMFMFFFLLFFFFHVIVISLSFYVLRYTLCHKTFCSFEFFVSFPSLLLFRMIDIF